MHNSRLEVALLRYGVGNIIDSIDQLDPCSRTRQPSALSHLQGRYFARRFHRALIVSLLLLFAVVMLAAFT